MNAPLSIDPIALLTPLADYIVEDLSNADIAATATLAASALSELAAPILKMITSAGMKVVM